MSAPSAKTADDAQPLLELMQVQERELNFDKIWAIASSPEFRWLELQGKVEEVFDESTVILQALQNAIRSARSGSEEYKSILQSEVSILVALRWQLRKVYSACLDLSEGCIGIDQVRMDYGSDGRGKGSEGDTGV